MWAQCDNIVNQLQRMKDNLKHKSDIIYSNVSQWVKMVAEYILITYMCNF